MIKIKYLKSGYEYDKVSILGHALYDDYGKDIVCAAVSSIVICSVNGILSIKERGLKYMKSDKGIIIDNISKDKNVKKLIDNMISLLKQLERDYPDNVKLEGGKL